MEFFTYILKSAGILGLFYAVYFLWLRKDTLFQAKRQFLLLGLIASVTLPFVEIIKSVTIEIPELVNTINNGVTSVPVLSTNDSFQLDLWEVLLLCYLLGAIVMSFRFIKELYVLGQLLISGNAEKVDGALHIKTSLNHAPFSFFNYIVYNPKIHHTEELHMIIKHEKVHANQWHSLDILLVNIFLVTQWVNPIAWLFKKSIEENLEFIADYKTVQQVPSKKAYQLALVKASSTFTTPALTNNFYQSFIKKRIIMLNKRNSRKVNVLKVGIILPLLALFLWSFNTKEEVTYKTIPSIEKLTIEPKSDVITTSEKAEESTKEENKEVTKPAKVETPKVNKETNHKIEPISEKYSVKITKNTTNSEFEKIKKEVKEKYNVDLSYTVVRNDNNEIISLTMNYVSSENDDGRSGNYNVNDDDGIEEFLFYLDDEGNSGFWSEAAEERRLERMERRRREMEERRETLDERREERRKELKEREKELAKRRKKIEKRRNTQVASIGSNSNNNATYSIATGSGTNSQVAVISGSEDAIIINKNTSDKELAKMKKDLAKKNIDFSYKNIKRNGAGEITGLKITVDNNKGSKSTSVIKGDDDEPIEQIIINQ